MKDLRIDSHPILEVRKRNKVKFYWNGEELEGIEGEMLSSSLFANDIKIFGHHPKDKSPQGIFCANGQCSQCMVTINGLPVKSCMTPLKAGMRVEPLENYPKLPEDNKILKFTPPKELKTDVLIVGGGPAGMNAAIELSKYNIKTIIVDDRHRMGGKLVLQTHKFFGSQNTCYAGTRGIDIATLLENKIETDKSTTVWTNSVAVGVYSDKKVGILKGMKEYILIEPKVLLVATGAREKSLVFKGNTLPGVYGAGAFQTIVNRDLIRASEKLFIIGGGNVGLIAGYHALQAGIPVVGLVEAMKEVGGYKVHKDKLARLGVPILTSHTVVSANGKEFVESITIANVDEKFSIINGTEKTFECDTILVAVGLNPVDEFYKKARLYNMNVYAAGDAEEIAEASAAIYSGKILGAKIANHFIKSKISIPKEWENTANILKMKPGKTFKMKTTDKKEGVFPIINCIQEIPCNPCITVCPKNCIKLDGDSIMNIPIYDIDECIGCEQCVAICPGLAISLVDFRKSPDYAVVTIPFEFKKGTINVGDIIQSVDIAGNDVEMVEILDIKDIKKNDRTSLLKLKVSGNNAKNVIGIRIQKQFDESDLCRMENIPDDAIVCRCERVSAGDIRKLIHEGIYDMNQIKIITRAGMGACGGKTCQPIIENILKQEGVPKEDIIANTDRPLFVEVELNKFSTSENNDE